ncbi:MAG TPA: TAXI family TRAP transporter solute-binding subunit [Chloroflexota bacterium]|nr:TAXI family TRAP transporter solute-binding subunit [Chloroflexota bacterium]
MFEREKLPANRPRATTVRSLFMLQVASALVADPGWPDKQAWIRLRPQGEGPWPMNLYASDSPAGIQAVASGEAQFAIINPAVAAGPAVRGIAPFAEPLPLRAITTIPSFDQVGLAVSERLGISSLEELAQRKPALRVSVRGQPDHAVHMVIGHMLQAAGFSLDDMNAWGGTVRWDTGLPHEPTRTAALKAGELDAMFDEGIYNWVDLALDNGLRFLSLSEESLRTLEGMGYRRSVIPKANFPRLPADVPTLDFSGFMVYTHAGVPDDAVTAFCAAIDQERERIPWQGGPSLPLEHMCRDVPGAPVPIPFHPAAERFWRSRGYLD